MRRLLALSAALLLAACTTTQTYWSKPGATNEQFMRDRLTCRQYGMQSAQAEGLAGNMFVELHIQSEAADCLRSLGYTAEIRKVQP